MNFESGALLQNLPERVFFNILSYKLLFVAEKAKSTWEIYLLIVRYRKFPQLAPLLAQLEKQMKLKPKVLCQLFQIRDMNSSFLIPNFKIMSLIFLYSKPRLPVFGGIMRCWPLKEDKRVIFYKDVVLMRSALDGRLRLYYKNVEVLLSEFLLPVKNYIYGRGGY
jgi:hypothetical protein